MRAISLFLAAAILQCLLAVPASALDDGHSLEAIREAVQSPIPDSVIEQARQMDDQILRTGTADGTKVSSITDERLQHMQALVRRVLAAIGENPQAWVIRLLDSDPKIPNAFVYGGKYIYVFTGLVDQARSDSELAVVIGHEIGHSVLKHNIRRNSDLTSMLANLATVVGQIKGGSGGANAMAIGNALHNGYSRDDEREADAFGVLAAWSAGFDPIKGADFFTRQEQGDDKELDDYKAQALVVKSQCETWTQQFNSGQLAHTQQNLTLIEQRCAQYEQRMNSYNSMIAQRAVNMGDHPGDQERVAAIAAETDWLHGGRKLKSMQSYPRAYTVIVALVQTKSPIFAGLRTTGGSEAPVNPHAETTDSSPPRQSAANADLRVQREPAEAQDAKADADAAAASAAALEAERQRIAAARQREVAVSYEEPRAGTPAERRESQF